MPAKLLMLQGTASSVGKSLLATALCRIFRQDGFLVAPFKAQNMSNNSYVTLDGGEIGRAQAAQAEACGIEPSVEMNPILLKPQADHRSQVVILGKAAEALSAREYYQRKAELQPVVLGALERLRSRHDVVVIEGAGSPAEINLRGVDLVNMGLAQAVEAPVLLVGDIDRGGVFAHLVGTLELLEPKERALIRATVVNKFRGDLALLDGGLEFLQQRTGVPVLGVVPYLESHGVPEEDSALLGPVQALSPHEGLLHIAVIRLPRISNFTDFEPLAQEPSVWLRYVARPASLGDPDLIIIPGTKSTIADLAYLRDSGLAPAIQEFAAAGGAVMGICGGLQMLGTLLRDPEGIESEIQEVPGLRLLPLVTTFSNPKTTIRVEGRACALSGPLAAAHGCWVRGYEIHNGRSEGEGAAAFQAGDHEDGAVSAKGNVFGTYIHGVFDEAEFRGAFLKALALGKGLSTLSFASAQPRDGVYDRLAARVRAALDIEKLYEIVNL